MIHDGDDGSCLLNNNNNAYCWRTMSNFNILYYRHAQTQVARATTLCKTARNICGSPVWNLLHVSLITPRNFEVAPRFFLGVGDVGNPAVLFYQNVS